MSLFELIDLSDEKSPTFYFYCEVIAHQEKICDKKIFDSRKSQIYDSQYGEWMRAQIAFG